MGIVLGIIMALVVPTDMLQSGGILGFFSELAVRSVSFILIPVLFFGITVSVFRLRETKLLLKTVGITALITVASSVLFTMLGLISVFLVRLQRIPISVDRVSQIASLNIQGNILKLFPYSGFESLIDGVYLLPLVLFGVLAGFGCASDKIESKPTITLFESLSKVCYSVMAFFIDIFSIGLIAVSCSWAIEFFQVLSTGIYNGLIIMIASLFILIVVVFYPLVLRLVCKEYHPYRVLFAAVAPMAAAFVSGNSNIALAVNLRHGNESLGIKRKLSSVTMPLFSIFARGGSALVTAISFVIILKSYSSLSIAFIDVLWIAFFSCLCSFCLGALPTGGAYVALTVLCTMYGRGFEAGYLLLRPAAPLLCAFGAAIDAVTMIFGSYITANKLKMTERIDIKYFI